MKLHIIIHEDFEGPAAILEWIKEKKHAVTFSRVYAGDVLPKDTADFDFLIVMGGPQSPSTTLKACPYFDAKAEIALIKQAAQQEKYVLGICLGAQLIGEAFGAAVERSPHKEIGVFDIHLTQAGLDDPLFSQFPATFLVGHWHGDMPGISEGATLLAYSAGCPRQIVRYSPKVYGFQCHFEFTSEAIETMLSHCGHEIEAAKNSLYIQSGEALRKHNYNKMNQLLYSFLDSLTSIA